MTERLTTRYDLRGLLGEGGMGRVWRAWDRVLAREVALKQRRGDALTEAALQQEFWWMTRLKDPHLVDVYDYGLSAEGQAYYTMELVEGADLETLLPLPADQVLVMVRHVARALRRIHLDGLVHGDLKPANIRRTIDGTYKLMDFGLMRPAGQPVGLRGTLGYLAPEMIQRAPVDPRADLYTLGVVIYQALTGELPFPCEEPLEALRAHLTLSPPRPSRLVPNLAPLWDGLVTSLLAKDPARRPQSVSEVLSRLGEVVPPDPAVLMCPPFVGRERELQRFDALLDGLDKDSAAATWVLEAAPGAGKSRLLEECHTRAQLAGSLVLQVKVEPGASPYQPLRDLLRQALQALSEDEGLLLSTHREALQPLGLVAGPPDEGGAGSPRAAQLRLQAALNDILLAVGDGRSLVVLLDDWHLAAPEAQQLWTAFQQAGGVSTGLLSVLTRDAASTPEAAEDERVQLPALRPREVARFLGGMFGAPQVPAGFVQQVQELADGNPGRIQSLIEFWVSQDLIPQAEGAWQLERLGGDLHVPSSQRLLEARLADLTPAARRLVGLLAFLEGAFDFALMEHLLPDVSAEERRRAIADLERQRIVRRVDGQADFAPQHLARTLREATSAEAARQAHRRLAAAWLACHPDAVQARTQWCPTASPAPPPNVRLGDLFVHLANHLFAADEALEAIPWAAGAVRHLITQHATAAASALARRAAEAAGGVDGERLLDIPLRVWKASFETALGDLARLSGALGEAERCYQAALSCLEDGQAPHVIVRARIGLGLTLVVRSQEEALAHLREALPMVRALQATREELRCLAASARATYQLGDMVRARALYEETLALAERCEDESYRGECLCFLGFLDVTDPPKEDPMAAQRGLERIQRAIGIQTRLADKLALNDTYMLFGNALYQLGELPAAEYAFLRNQALCHELGFHEEAIALVNLAMITLDRGDHANAFLYGERAIALAEPLGHSFVVDLARGFQARTLAATGEFERSWSLLEEVLTRRREADDPYGELFTLRGALELSWCLGHWEAAEANLLAALDAQARSGIREQELAWGLYGARLALKRGQQGAAEAGLREGLLRAETRGAQVWEAQYCLALGELVSVDAGATEAAAWFERAETLATTCEARPVLIEALFWRARLARTQGQTLEADGWLHRAQDLAMRCQMPDWQARLAYERAWLHAPSPRAAQWLREASEHLTPLHDGLAEARRNAYLAKDHRAQMLGRVLPVQSDVASAEPLSDRDPRDLERQLQEARRNLAQHQQWFDDLQHTAERLQMQLDFAHDLQRLDDEETILRRTLQVVMGIARLERADLLLFDGLELDCRLSLERPGGAGLSDPWGGFADLLLDTSQLDEIQFIRDTQALPAWSHLPAPRALLTIPLQNEAGRWGLVLGLGHPELVGPLAAWDLDALRLVTQQLVAASRRLRLEAEWRSRADRLEMLYALSSKVSSTLVMAEVLDLVLRYTLDITQAERGLLFLCDAEGELRAEAARTLEGPIAAATFDAPVSRSTLRRVLESGEAICTTDARDDDSLRQQKSIQDLDLRTLLAVPLRAQKRALGVLYVDSRMVVNAFTERDLELLKAIASHASVALENARLYDLATVDRLTKLYFRSHFEQRLTEEIQRALRLGSVVSLLMMDIDHFKKFNDTYGHAVGDQVLAHVAGVIRANVRQDIDVPCRYGGEEMVVLLPDTDAAGAWAFAERLRLAIATNPLPTEAHGPLGVTVSIGAATCPDHAQTGFTLMELADQALYASKRGGRNQVTSYQAVGGLS
ncbi:MAG: diguanylate cyclase [Candidatus Sericytochromatia bacterium]|nr:diguanylate cyclase [Candidatus Sericytochromatia bacterium]